MKADRLNTLLNLIQSGEQADLLLSDGEREAINQFNTIFEQEKAKIGKELTSEEENGLSETIFGIVEGAREAFEKQSNLTDGIMSLNRRKTHRVN